MTAAAFAPIQDKTSYRVVPEDQNNPWSSRFDPDRQHARIVVATDLVGQEGLTLLKSEEVYQAARKAAREGGLVDPCLDPIGFQISPKTTKDAAASGLNDPDTGYLALMVFTGR